MATKKNVRPQVGEIGPEVKKVTDNNKRSRANSKGRVGFSLTIPEDLLAEAKEFGESHHRSVASLLIEGLEMRLGK